MDLKKILFFVVACLAVVFTAGAQQQGIVRSLERPKQPSKGLAGATVNILELKNDLVTDKDGKFSFTIRDKNSFKVTRVQKKGYTLVDKQLLGRKFSYSSVPIEIVMVSDKQLASDKKLIEDKAYDRAKKTYEARIAELERQLAEKTITEKAYYAEREVAINDYDKYVQLIDEMAERYAMTDYKGLSDINRQIQECIENAELERADSLINSKGDFDQREQELLKKKETTQRIEELYNKSQEDYQYTLNDLARDYYNKYTILAANYRNDSSAYWLERRAALDTTNIFWQNDAGCFIYDYSANYPLAMDYYQRALSQSMIQYGEQSEYVANLYNNIGNVYHAQGDYAKALENHQKSLSISERVLDPDHPDMVLLYNNIGADYNRQGDHAKALEYHQKSLSICERVFGPEHPDVARSYHNIGSVYSEQGDYANALEYYQKSLSICERVLGPYHPDVASSYNSIGNDYYIQGNYAKALEYYQKCLSIRERVLGPEHHNVALCYKYIGNVYKNQGDYAKALEYYQKCLSISERVLGPEHLDVARLYEYIGLVYYNQGDYANVLECYQKCLSIRVRVLGLEHPDVAETYHNVGMAYLVMEDYAKSLEYLTKAHNVYLRLCGPNHINTQFAKDMIDYLKGLLEQ